VYWAAAEVPAGVVTVTSTEPLDEAAVAVPVKVVSSVTVIPVPGLDPKVTAVAPVSPLPVTVTWLAPADGPWVGFSALTRPGREGAPRRSAYGRRPTVGMTAPPACRTGRSARGARLIRHDCGPRGIGRAETTRWSARG
jgi:hypothetical protein